MTQGGPPASGAAGGGEAVTVPEKTCSRCKLSKPLEAFYRQAKEKDGRSSACKACTKAAYPTAAQRRKADAENPGGKKCKGCKETLPLSAFGRRADRPDGRQCRCRECERANGRELRQKRAAEDYAPKPDPLRTHNAASFRRLLSLMDQRGEDRIATDCGVFGRVEYDRAELERAIKASGG